MKSLYNEGYCSLQLLDSEVESIFRT